MHARRASDPHEWELQQGGLLGEVDVLDASFDEDAFLKSQINRADTNVRVWKDVLEPEVREPSRAGSQLNLALDLEQEREELAAQLEQEKREIADQLAEEVQELRAQLELEKQILMDQQAQELAALSEQYRQHEAEYQAKKQALMAKRTQLQNEIAIKEESLRKARETSDQLLATLQRQAADSEAALRKAKEERDQLLMTVSQQDSHQRLLADREAFIANLVANTQTISDSLSKATEAARVEAQRQLREMELLRQRAQRYEQELSEKDKQISETRQAIMEAESAQSTAPFLSPPTSQTFETDGPDHPPAPIAANGAGAARATPGEKGDDDPLQNDEQQRQREIAMETPTPGGPPRPPGPRRACTTDANGERQCNMSAMCLVM